MKPVPTIAYAVTACAAALLLGWAVSGNGAIHDATASPSPASTTAPAALSATAAAVPTAKAERPRALEERAELSRQLAANLSGRGELSQSLRQLEKLCGGMAPSPCIDDVLAGLPASRRQTLSDILARLPLLGPRLSALVMSTQQPLQERIDAVSQVRAQVLGAANARLLFGRQEAQLRYEAQLQQFIESDAAGMPLAQRLSAAEALLAPLRQDDTAPAANDPAEQARRYQLTLRLALLDAANDADRARITQQVRSQFFPPEKVEQLARNDRFDAQQRDRMAQYAERKQAIQARYAGAADATALQQRDAELEALRRDIFPDSFHE